VVRANGDGTLTPIATGLTFPTGTAFGPDGANFGLGTLVEGVVGQIVRVVLSNA